MSNIRYDRDGLPHRVTPTKRKSTPRVTFGRTEWSGGNGKPIVNEREVRLDGKHVGYVYGIDPAPGNPHRPTAYDLRLVGHRPVLQDRLDPVREDVLRLLG